MKTNVFKLMAAFFVAALSLGFTSCGDDDDDGGNVSSGNNILIGTWHHYWTALYTKDKYSVRYTFEKNGKGLHYYLPVDLRMDLDEPGFENNQEFNYSIKAKENGKITLTLNYTNNSLNGKTEVFDDVYVLGDALYLDGEMYERVVINN